MSSCHTELTLALQRYAPLGPDERAFLSRFRALVECGPAVLTRDHTAPGHVTASAFILAPERDALLLIYHQKLLLWLQPGGHIEAEDVSPEAAARREAAEEVGLRDLELLVPGIFDLDIHEIPARKGEPAHAHFDVRYLFRAHARDVLPASDAAAARFVPLATLTSAQSDQSVMRAVHKLRAL